MARWFQSGSMKPAEAVLSESEADLNRLSELVIEMRNICEDSLKLVSESRELLRRCAEKIPSPSDGPPPRQTAEAA